MIEGVSITLYGVPTDTETAITVEVDYDYSGTKDAIQAFIDAYNDLRSYVVEQQATNSDGGAADAAVLYSDTTLKTYVNSIYSIVNGTFSGSDMLTSLADIGITFDGDNMLEISDETLLNDALINNYTEVMSLFQTSVETSSDNLSVLRSSSTQASLSFTLDIEVDGNGNITGALVNGDSSAFTVSGSRLIGIAGTIYEGITLAYVGTTNASLDVDLGQGLADRLYNLVDSYSNTTDGILQDRVTRLSNYDDTLQMKSDRIKERAEAYRETLIEKYAAMEAKISSANSLLAQIQALWGTNGSDS